MQSRLIRNWNNSVRYLKLLAEHLSLSRCCSFEQMQSNCSKKQMLLLQWCALVYDVKFSSKCNASLLRGSESCQMQPQWFILPLLYINHGLCLEWNSWVLLTVYCFWLWQSDLIISMEGDAKKSYMKVLLKLFTLNIFLLLLKCLFRAQAPMVHLLL